MAQSVLLTVNNIVALILGIVGIVWIFYGIWRNLKINRISSWPKTNALVLNSVAEPANSEAGNTYVEPRYIIATTDDQARYIPKVTYKYTVNKTEYQSNNVVYAGEKSYSAIDIKTMLGLITPGSTIPVYYNPGDPSESYIYNGLHSYTGIIIGAVLLALSGFLSYFGSAIKKSKSNNSDVASPSLTEIENSNRTAKKNTTVTKTTITKSLLKRDIY